MVNPMSLFFMSASFLVSIAVPFVTIIALCVMKKISPKGILFGISLFCMVEIVWMVLMNLVLGIGGINTLLTQNLWTASFLQAALMALLVAFGRSYMNRSVLGELATWRGNCAFGFGYGTAYAGMYFSIQILNDMMAAVALNQEMGENAAENVITYVAENRQRLTTTPPLEFLFPGLQAMGVVLIQIALCLLVLYAVKRKKTVFVWITAAIQTVIFVAYDMLQSAFGTWGSTAWFVACGIGGIVWIVKSKDIFADEVKKPFSRRSPLL